MTIFQVFFGVFDTFSALFRPFRAFLTPGPRGPGNPFSDFFRSFLGRGLFDPCRRPTMSQSKPASVLLGSVSLRENLSRSTISPAPPSKGSKTCQSTAGFNRTLAAVLWALLILGRDLRGEARDCSCRLGTKNH